MHLQGASPSKKGEAHAAPRTEPHFIEAIHLELQTAAESWKVRLACNCNVGSTGATVIPVVITAVESWALLLRLVAESSHNCMLYGGR
jgi:hypothetical protein